MQTDAAPLGLKMVQNLKMVRIGWVVWVGGWVGGWVGVGGGGGWGGGGGGGGGVGGGGASFRQGLLTGACGFQRRFVRIRLVSHISDEVPESKFGRRKCSVVGTFEVI